MALNLVTLRHAPTDADGLCVGQHDVATHMSHARAAELLLEHVHSQGPLPSVVWSSPLSRCREPAVRVAAALSLPHRVDARVLEIHYGEWQGRAWSEIERVDGERWARFMRSWQHEAPPGGEDLKELEARVRAWHAELGTGRHALIAHSGVVRALRVVSGETWLEAMKRPVPHLLPERFVGSGPDAPGP